MKLQELRQQLKEYEEAFYLRKYLVGDHDRAKRLRQFVQRFKYMPEDYELNAEDVFRLLREVPEIAKPNSNLELMQTIKQKLASPYFFELYIVLSNLKLINEKNFAAIYEQPLHIHLFLQRVFCSDSPQPRIPLNQELLNIILAIIPQIEMEERVIEQLLRFLHNRNLLKPIALSLLQTRIKEVSSLFNVMQELQKACCLNEECFELIAQLTHLFLLERLLVQLNKARVPLNNEVIKALCASNSLVYLDKLLPILSSSEKPILNNVTFTLLLKKSYEFFIEKMRTFELLQQYGLLDEEIFAEVCNREVFSLTRILGVLSEKSLLHENKELILDLINNKLDGSALYKAINYLKKVNLLEQDSLNLCVECVLTKRIACGLFDLLEQSNVTINKSQLQAIFSLSVSNLRRLNSLLEDLKYRKLLDQASFAIAFERAVEKFPPVFQSTITKYSRKDTGAQRSEYILDNASRFFIEHGDQEQGGCGSVKKGYESATTQIPLYSIKKLHRHAKVQEGIREVKYNRLLGRNASFFIRNESINVVSEWQHGKGMHYYSADELRQIPLKARLLCLSAGLKDLNTLHQHHRKHGDVKCQNFVLNLEDLSMRLIDFGTTHKKGSFKSFGWTCEYLDPKINADLLCVDLYAMGIVTMHLFPEIYKVSFENKSPKFSWSKSHFSIWEQAIITLVEAMMHADLELRCTSEDALNYCSEVLNYFDIMDAQLLETIAYNSINRSHSSLEDILRR